MSPMPFMKTMLYAPSNFLLRLRKTSHEIGPIVAAQLVAQVVHDDLGVEVAHQVVIFLVEQFGFELGIVRHLAVERHREPFPLAAMITFEGLGVVLVVLAAGGVADMPDGGPAGVLAS